MFSSNTTQVSDGGYQISRSLRFNSADSAYLNRTPASGGNQSTWTYSAWIKRSALGVAQTLFQQQTASSDTGYFNILFFAGDTLGCSGWSSTWRVTTQVFRDPSAWYHLVVAVDTTQATANNRIRVYINGSEITSFSTTNNPTQNSTTGINGTGPAAIGREYNGTLYYNGYMTEIYMVDGSQLTPSSFGETNAQTGVWQPKAYSGSYGTNGFYLNFSDNSNTTAATLGKDYSGNGNNWTPNNFSVTAGAGNDSLVDSPTSYGTDTGVGGTVRGNYATINPLRLISNVAVSNGNLYFQSNNNQDQFASAPSTIAVRTGKWYAEFTCVAVAGTPTYGFGVGRATWSPVILDGGGYYGRWWYTAEGYSYLSNGSFYTGNSAVSSAATFANGDIIGVAMDLDAGSIAFYKNGTLQGTPFTSIPLGVDYVFAGAAFTTPYPTPTNIGAFFANFGQRPFAYTAPSGFKALCTQNLPTPTIGATTATQAGKYFGVTLRTGGAPSGGTYTTTVDMSNGALLWDKARNGAQNNYLVDSNRGLTKFLQSNATTAESTQASWYTSFGNGTYSTGSTDWGSSVSLVDWIWAAGANTTNTAGSITSTVSANTTSGFSVVTWTGNSADASIGHGLGVAPSMVIHKFRSAVSNWSVYTSTTGAGKRLKLNSSDAVATDGSFPTTPTSSVFYINGGSNDNGVTMVAYCFAEVSGYSKIGSYTGNGSATGPFIYCGFRPAFVLIKNSTTSGPQWWILDNKRNVYNPEDLALPTSLALAEQTIPTCLNFLSNGFQITTTNGDFNTSGSNYIYMAFAESPFKYSLAR